jgi:hypothetical protein
MIDMLSLLISHGVILLAAWRLLPRADLDADPVESAIGQAGDGSDA